MGNKFFPSAKSPLRLLLSPRSWPSYPAALFGNTSLLTARRMLFSRLAPLVPPSTPTLYSWGGDHAPFEKLHSLDQAALLAPAEPKGHSGAPFLQKRQLFCD